MTADEKKALAEQIGKEAAEKIDAKFIEVKTEAEKIAREAAANGGISKEAFEAFQKKSDEAVEAIKEQCNKQGLSIAELLEKSNGNDNAKTQGIAQVLKAHEEELRQIYKSRSGSKEFLLTVKNGQLDMRPIDTSSVKNMEEVSKAAGVHGTIDGLGASVTSSIAESLAASTRVRMGADAGIYGLYRNTPWVFQLCSMQTVGIENLFAVWLEEQAKQGSSADRTEGATRSQAQYAYTIKTEPWKIRSLLVSFTDQFALDFRRLEDDIMMKTGTDMVNDLNTAILPNILSVATAYNTATNYRGGAISAGNVIANCNDYHVISALKAQANSATFGAATNAAVMSTYKYERIGTLSDTTGNFIQPPASLANVTYVNNPGMGTDDILVGDMKAYNILMRGGLIVRIGFNGNDFGDGKFSVVMDQYYMDYCPVPKRAGIVKGTTFASVKTALTATS